MIQTPVSQLNEKPLTFRSLELAEGIEYIQEEHKDGDSPLAEWYESIRDVLLHHLSVGDLAKACRQDLWVEYLIPVCLKVLRANPLVGYLYDGELLLALKGIKPEYWEEHSKEYAEFANIAQRVSRQTGNKEFDLNYTPQRHFILR